MAAGDVFSDCIAVGVSQIIDLTFPADTKVCIKWTKGNQASGQMYNTSTGKGFTMQETSGACNYFLDSSLVFRITGTLWGNSFGYSGIEI